MTLFRSASSFVLSTLLLAGAVHGVAATEHAAPASPDPSHLSQLLDQERQATRAGEPTQIIARCRSLVAAALVELANMRAEAGDHADAVPMYKSAVATEPTVANELALSRELLASGDAADAKSIAQEVLEAHPGDKQAFALANGRMDKRLPAAPSRAGSTAALTAEARLRRILASAYDDWGTAVIDKQSDYQGAFLLFQAATRWDPTAPGAMQHLGLAAFRLGRFDAGADAFRAVLESTPGDEQAHVLLGLSLFSLKQFAAAADAFAPARAATLANSAAAYAWAFSLAHTGEPLKANHVLDAIAARPMPPENRLLVCQVYDQTENYEQAVACLRQLAQQSPSLAGVHASIGESLIHLSRPGEAIPELRDEIKLHPNSLQAETFLAYALTATGQQAEAEKLLLAIVAAQPGDGNAQYQLGKLLAAQQQWAQAIVHLRAAAAASPGDYDIHYQLQNAYRRNGQEQDADRELAIYRTLKEAPHPEQGAH